MGDVRDKVSPDCFEPTHAREILEEQQVFVEECGFQGDDDDFDELLGPVQFHGDGLLCTSFPAFLPSFDDLVFAQPLRLLKTCCFASQYMHSSSP